MKAQITVIALLIVAATTTSAFAKKGDDKGGKGKGERPTAEQMFERMDTDGNGVISKAEFKTAHEKRAKGGKGGKGKRRGDDDSAE